MSETKRILFFSVLTFLFFVSGFIIPVAGIVLLPFSSVFLILLFIKNGVSAGIIGIILSSLAVYKIIPEGDVFLALFVLFVVLNSIILYCGIVKKNNPWRIILDSCLVITAVLVIIMVSINIGGFQASWIFEKIMEGLPKDKADTIVKIISRNIYVIASIFTIINIFLSYIFLSFTSAKFNIALKKLPPFERWRMPEKMIFLFIFSLLFYSITAYLNYNTVSQVFENLFYFIFFLYFIGGMALTRHFFIKSRVAAVVTYLIFFLYPPLAALLGIFDIWFDFRTKRVKRIGQTGGTG